MAGTVRDTLVIVNQTATVSGDVGRDAIVVNGTLRLEPTAHIGGDVVLINGELSQADGAVIAGSVVERRGASIGAEFNRVTAAVSLIAWLGMTLLLSSWRSAGPRSVGASFRISPACSARGRGSRPWLR